MQQGIQPTQDVATGGSMGGTTGGMQGGGMQGAGAAGHGMGLALADVETPQQREAVEAIARSTQVCGWCAEQCIQHADPHMVDCIRLCEDVAELGEAALVLVPRNSRFATDVLQTFARAAQACAQECGQHQDAHCQECAAVLGRATDAVYAYLDSQMGGGGQMTGQTGGMAQQGGQFGQQGTQMGGIH